MENNRPLCVDLDGTVTLLDTLLIGAVLFIRKNPLNAARMALWLFRGRPSMKEELFQQIMPNPQDIPYNTNFLAWLHQEKQKGRKIYLATASNYRVAKVIADHLGLFDGIEASNAEHNLKSAAKAAALTKRFGYQGYDYAGNSDDDFAVWHEAHGSIVVNPTPDVLKNRQRITNLIAEYPVVKIKKIRLLFSIKPSNKD